MSKRKWDSSRITRTIRAFHRQGLDISYNAMARIHQGLVSASNYYFGSYRRAVEAAGFDYSNIQRKPRWNRSRVVEVIRKAHKAGEDLSWAMVSKRRDDLGCAAKAAIRDRTFGNWNDALKAAGLDPDQISRYRHWSKRAIQQELRKRRKTGLGVNSRIIQQELPGLYGAAVRRFGSYEEALRQSGVNPATIVQRRQWSRAEVIRQLQAFEKKYKLVSQVTLRNFDSGLLRAVRIYFGDLKSGIRAAKIRNYSVRGHRVRKPAKLARVTPGWRKQRAVEAPPKPPVKVVRRTKSRKPAAVAA